MNSFIDDAAGGNRITTNPVLATTASNNATSPMIELMDTDEIENERCQ